jgi:phosphoribosylformylglycinamidine synthase subunit PurL
VSETLPLLQGSSDAIASSLRKHGIRAAAEELAAVAHTLGRDLTVPEAFLLDVAYSEHCSYKSSRRFLRSLLPPLAPHVLIGPGEDAGVIDIGAWDGIRYALVVAHESHNHPSQLLPVEGAATGIGGIVRDVYCMGADVIGVLDGLRFGDLDGDKGETARAVARGVVRGIWEYGDALGVPNLGGEVSFDPCYDDNCLVNVVALGIARSDRVLRSRVPENARSEPYEIVLVGKPTDRSGLGGASFASQILDEGSTDTNLGAVQIHDPFLKRVVVEATKMVWDLLAERGCQAGFKDLGAGGFGGASSELVVAGGFGAEIDLDRMPAAIEGMRPEHLLIGETQERFVWALPSWIVPDVLAIYNDAFDLPGIYPGARAESVGRVVTSRRYRVTWKGETIVDFPFAVLEESPVLERPLRPRPVAAVQGTLREPKDWKQFLTSLLSHPAVCSRAHIYRHYDAEVRGEALFRPGEADAGVCRPIPGASLGLAVSLDGNERWCDLDPYHGAVATVLEAVRNVVAVGARPRALTDCLNFGSPEDPECLWEFEQALSGMHDACVGLGLPENRADALPIVSGNVSFYNQSAAGRRIKPTPIVACFGLLDDWRRAVRPRWQRPGNGVYWVGTLERQLGGSPALDILGGEGIPPHPDPAAEGARIYGVLDLLERGLVRACHDVAAGGILVAAAESLFHEERPTGRGLRLEIGSLGASPIESLLSESGGFLLEVDANREWEVRRRLAERGVEIIRIGEVLDTPSFITSAAGRSLFDVDVQALWEAWAGRLGPWIEGGDV